MSSLYHLQPDSVKLRYLKLGLFDLIEFIVWNIKGLRHRVADIGIKNLEFVAKTQQLYQHGVISSAE